jgi:transcriptional regulator with XRE-family HTH domain
MENMSRGKALSPETIGQIEQMNAEGKSISQICDALSVSSATVTRVRNGKLKSPEAPTPMENASEEIIDSGASADTNIIADVPEDVKKEAPIETLSRAFNALSEHIAQSFGSSAEEYSPYNSIVDEAVLERMENINFKIAQLKSEISVYEYELSKLNDYHTKYLEETENGKAG